jgi:hypothetical protein
MRPDFAVRIKRRIEQRKASILAKPRAINSAHNSPAAGFQAPKLQFSGVINPLPQYSGPLIFR